MDAMDRTAAAGLTVFSGIAMGALAMTGVVAAVAFPTMRALDPSLPGYAGYGGAHWSLAAGVLAERVFHIGFAVAGVCLLVCVGAVGVMLARREGGRMPIVRAGLLLVTLGVFLAHVAWLQPRMDEAAAEYRAAAAAGEGERAIAAKARFDGMHPNASRLVMGATASALALFAASAWAASGRRPAGGGA